MDQTAHDLTVCDFYTGGSLKEKIQNKFHSFEEIIIEIGNIIEAEFLLCQSKCTFPIQWLFSPRITNPTCSVLQGQIA